MTREEKVEAKIQKVKNKEKFRKINLVTGVLLGMYLSITGYLIYNLYRLSGIENIIRYSVMTIFTLFSLFLIIKYLKMRMKPMVKKYIIFIVVLLLFGGIEYFVGLTINKGLNVVDSISVKKYKTYSTSLITLKDNKIEEVSDLDSDAKIGRITDKNDIEGYVLTKELIKKDSIDSKQIEDYEDTITLLYDLYDKKIDAAFISTNYVTAYSSIEKFENIKDETVELDKYSKKMKVQKSKATTASTKSVTEPFTILLMGVDSTEKDLTEASGLGDSLMLITFNPNTLNATILSIPRDTFVPITCYGNKKSKITHAASGGDKCMINTIQNAFDVNVDYYAKINFMGLMELVDALDGIDVDVPYSFCETTMWRSLQYMVYVNEGQQHLNGEQALALSRNRKTYSSCGKQWNKGNRNDFVRGQNQQLVINSIINKAKNMNSINQFYGVLDAVGNSMTTNMDRKQILSFYNVFKNVILNSKDLQDGNDVISMQKMYLNGEGGLFHDNIMNMQLYEYMPSTQSLNAIIKAMKINLELVQDKPATSFSFSADEEYTQKVIGKDLTGGVDKSSATDNSSSTTEKKCTGTNEELGADKVTCVCKYGYTKNSTGTCVPEQEIKPNCGANSTYNTSSFKCECDRGYSLLNGVCQKPSTNPGTSTGDSGSGSGTGTSTGDSGSGSGTGTSTGDSGSGSGTGTSTGDSGSGNGLDEGNN